jgi:hypothetical protein
MVENRKPRTRKTATKYDMNLVKLMTQYNSEDKCRRDLEALR